MTNHKARTARRTKRSTKASEFESKLIKSLQQAVAIKKGELAPGREYTLPRTAREATVAEPRPFNQADVIRIRKKLQLSQAVFAQVLGKSAPTVRSWEQGQKSPDPAARRMLEIADRHPKILLELVRPVER